MTTISTGWQERIDAAQKQPTVEIYGKSYRRIRYGEESHATKYALCPDCRCELGQFHVPCCDVERCPRCGEQAIACDCGLAH